MLAYYYQPPSSNPLRALFRCTRHQRRLHGERAYTIHSGNYSSVFEAAANLGIIKLSSVKRYSRLSVLFII